MLAKGSQNGVYAEEAIKYILDDPGDAKLLVRQSKHWLDIKRRRFQKNICNKSRRCGYNH